MVWSSEVENSIDTLTLDALKTTVTTHPVMGHNITRKEISNVLFLSDPDSQTEP